MRCNRTAASRVVQVRALQGCAGFGICIRLNEFKSGGYDLTGSPAHDDLITRFDSEQRKYLCIDTHNLVSVLANQCLSRSSDDDRCEENRTQERFEDLSNMMDQSSR